MIKHKENTIYASPSFKDTAAKNDAYLASDRISDQVITGQDQEVKLQLREEILDIVKNWAQTGEFTMRKELVTEEKTITVPITREVLVIENAQFDENSSNNVDRKTEVIRIPLCEERIEVTKHPELLNDVSVYRQQFLEMQRVDAALKKEIVHVETKGHARVIDKKL